MNLEYTPQGPPGSPPHTLGYRADGDVLTVTHRTYKWGEPDEEGNREPVVDQETTDVFDFSGLPDGVLDDGAIETDLPVNPIVAAERVDGVLTVTVLDWTWRPTDG